jgi:hypothetical protein
MASRTRTHCPNCRTQYAPYARSCAQCGRTRDQISDAELAQNQPPAQRPGIHPLVFVGGGILAIIVLLTAWPAILIGGGIYAVLPLGFRSLSKKARAGIGGSAAVLVALFMVIGSAISRGNAPKVTGRILPGATPTPSPQEIVERQKNERLAVERERKSDAELKEYKRQQAQEAQALREHQALVESTHPTPLPTPIPTVRAFEPGRIYTGPRGGKYYYTSSGEKRYLSQD